MSTKPQISIQIVADINCPWCLIGCQRLKEAVEINADKYEFQLQYVPYLMHPNVGENGLNWLQFFKDKGINNLDWESYKARYDNNLVKTGKSLKYQIYFADITKDFTMYDTINGHRLAQWILKNFGQEKQVEFFQHLSKRYFQEKERINIYKAEILAEVAGQLGINYEYVYNFIYNANESPTEQDIRDMAKNIKEQYKVKVVPTYIINEKFQFNGAENPDSFTKWWQQVIDQQQQQQLQLLQEQQNKQQKIPLAKKLFCCFY